MPLHYLVHLVQDRKRPRTVPCLVSQHCPSRVAGSIPSRLENPGATPITAVCGMPSRNRCRRFLFPISLLAYTCNKHPVGTNEAYHSDSYTLFPPHPPSHLRRNISIRMDTPAAAKQPFRAIVVGGGPVGLTLAHTLAQANIEFELLEARDTVFAEEGASIILYPGAWRIYAQLGILDAAREVSFPMKSARIVSWDGKFARNSIGPSTIKEVYD